MVLLLHALPYLFGCMVFAYNRFRLFMDGRPVKNHQLIRHYFIFMIFENMKIKTILFEFTLT